jgi:hypothetical protein
MARRAAEGGGAAASRRPVGLGGGRPGGDLANATRVLERRRFARGRASAALHQDVGKTPAKRRRRRALAYAARGRGVAANLVSRGRKPYLEGTRTLLKPPPGPNGPERHGRPCPRPRVLTAPGDDGPPHRSRPSQAHDGTQSALLLRSGGRARRRHRARHGDGHGRRRRGQPLGAPLQGEVASHTHSAITSPHGGTPQPGAAPPRRRAPAHRRGRRGPHRRPHSATPRRPATLPQVTARHRDEIGEGWLRRRRALRGELGQHRFLGVDLVSHVGPAPATKGPRAPHHLRGDGRSRRRRHHGPELTGSLATSPGTREESSAFSAVALAPSRHEIGHG